MFVFPTSILLVSGLKLVDLDYKEWLKYIWKYLVIILFAVLIISGVLFKLL